MCFVCFWRTWFRRAGRASAERPSTLGERQRRARRRRRCRALFLLYVVDALSLVRCAPAASTPLVGSLVGLPVGRITTPASRGLGVAARRAGPPHALGRAVPPAHDPPRRRTPGEIERVVGEETNRSAPSPPLFVLGFTRPPARRSPPSADGMRATALPQQLWCAHRRRDTACPGEGEMTCVALGMVGVSPSHALERNWRALQAREPPL